MDENEEVELLSLDEVCMMLKCKRDKLLRLIHNDEIPRPIMVGKVRRWPRRVIVEWIAAKLAAAQGGE